MIDGRGQPGNAGMIQVGKKVNSITAESPLSRVQGIDVNWEGTVERKVRDGEGLGEPQGKDRRGHSISAGIESYPFV